MAKGNKTPCETEFSEQVAFVQYLELKGLKFTAIPNSTYTPSFAQKMKNKKMGLRPGLCDLLVILPNGYLAFVELKRVRGGQLSKEQAEWIDALNEVPHVKAFMARGSGEAIDMIELLLEHPTLTPEAF